MPRLLSSYAANKRVEDGLRKKQEEIRKDYMRATHRYLDETDKLVDELIQIHVRTPSVFPVTQTGSVSHHLQPKKTHHLPPQHPLRQQYPHTPVQQSPRDGPYSNSSTPGVPQDTLRPPHWLKSRSRATFLTEGTVTSEDSSPIRREIPPPLVEVRGNEVFYQYDCRPNQWKKIEPSYKTKVLLHRNQTVSKALQQHDERRPATAVEDTVDGGPKPVEKPPDMNRRKSSVAFHRNSLSNRRGSEFMRRGSRRGSRMSSMSDEDEEDFERIPPIIELKPQLSPGHTPRMIDGVTIMNWCLWKKQQMKPVWASKRYRDRKIKEYRRFQASRSAAAISNNLAAQPPKPSSANSSSREARRQSILEEEEKKVQRAKSVPAAKVSTTIEEVDEEEEMESFPEVKEVDKGILRPTTSILRARSGKAQSHIVDEMRPKTTQPRRRIALDILDHVNTDLNLNDNDLIDRSDGAETDDDNPLTFRDLSDDILVLRPKSKIKKEEKTVSLEDRRVVFSDKKDARMNHEGNVSPDSYRTPVDSARDREIVAVSAMSEISNNPDLLNNEVKEGKPKAVQISEPIASNNIFELVPELGSGSAR